jgi:hypothetical protein
MSDGQEWQCISSADVFLYQMIYTRRSASSFYPREPWEEQSEIPISTYSNAMLDEKKSDLQMVRTIEENNEFWIQSGSAFIQFTPAINEINIIPFSPFDENGKPHEEIVVKNIFETTHGKILGINYPDDYHTNWNQAYPLFSIYNETKKAFTFYDMGLSYTSEEIKFEYEGITPRYGVIISRVDDLIWIYQQEDGLYRYDPDALSINHYETNFDGVVQTVLATHENFLWIGQEIDGEWLLTPGEVLKYYPDTQITEEIHVPFFRWPDYGNWIYTNSGDLWIGIHGYYSHEGKWVLKNPNRFAYTNLGTDSHTYNWQHPDLIYQSSNGYLWYKNIVGDGLGADGLAWLDPETNTGCWFTTEPANIVEDQNQTLWMVIGNRVYKYKIPY